MNSVLRDSSKGEFTAIPSSSESVSGSGDENHTLLEHDESQEEHRAKYVRRRWLTPSRLIAMSVANVLLCIVSLTLFGIWYYNTHMLLNPRLRQISSFTPVLDRIDLPMLVKKINGTLYPSKNPSVARQMPNDEADKIWEEWEIGRIIPVTADDIRKMGKDPTTVAKLEDDQYGLGDDAYATIFDVFHQLHCLNVLRHLAYPEHYKDLNQFHNEAMQAIHVNHCVDIIMQALQCSGNLNLITMHWVENEPWPFPDMSANRQCIDFEYLTQWRLENSVDLDTYIKYSDKPEGVTQLPSPDAYYEFFNPNNLTNPNHPNGSHPDEDFNL